MKLWPAFIAFGFSVAGWASTDGAARFRPADDATVLVRVRPAGLRAAERELRALRQVLENDPGDLPSAVDLARLLITRNRAEADPRFLGQAEAVLAPWWRQEKAPVDVLILRATIEQSRHEFAAAQQTLDRALAVDPRSGAAWLTKATLHTLRGEYPEARRACLSLSRWTDPLTTLTAAASVGGLTGSGVSALQNLTQALAKAESAEVPTRIWSHGVAAELAERLGRPSEAEAHHRAALQLAPADPFALGAFADFLLNQGRSAEVLKLLENSVEADGVLLRRAEAQIAATGRCDPKLREQLIAGFTAGRRRGISHAREEARFFATIDPDPAKALSLAQENWQTQREPVDLRLLYVTARRANDTATREAAKSWARTNGLEDAVLDRLVSTP